jgi:hypothetical protein
MTSKEKEAPRKMLRGSLKRTQMKKKATEAAFTTESHEGDAT